MMPPMTSRHVLSAGVLALATVFGGTAVAAASPADDAQIRTVVDNQAVAIKALDNAKLATYFCDQYRGTVQSHTAEDQIPPMSQAAQFGTGPLAAVLSAAGVSQSTSDALIDAVQRGDDAAYRAAARKAAGEIFAGVTYDVSDINVTDNTATAAVTAQGHGVTAHQSREFVKEGGVWKDCTDPDKRAQTEGNPLLTSLLQ